MLFLKKIDELNVTKNRHFMHIMVFVLCCALCAAMLPLAPSTQAAEEPCTAVFKNGEFLFAVSTQQMAKNVLDRYCGDFQGANPQFDGQVTIEDVQAQKHMILSEDEAYALLKDGDFLSVTTVAYKTVEETVAYTEEELRDDTLYEGDRVILCEGRNGLQSKEVHTFYKNGILQESRVQAMELVKPAVHQVVRVGTKPRPSDIGTGEMATPCAGRFESPFGARWGRQHKGVDISNATDTPIYAADNGRVIYAGFMSGFGQLIQVDHNNGLVTYYAHLNTMHVRVGDVVEKGQHIGGMGATGNVTGTHLHFEVRQNGVAVDPLAYVGF